MYVAHSKSITAVIKISSSTYMVEYFQIITEISIDPVLKLSISATGLNYFPSQSYLS